MPDNQQNNAITPKPNSFQDLIAPHSGQATPKQPDTATKIIEGACQLVLIPDSPESVVPEAPYGRKRIVKYMWCDEETFFVQLQKDIEAAVAIIIIQSPYLYANRLEKMEPYIRAALARGILVCIFIQKPKEWDERNNQFFSYTEREKLLNLEKRVERLKQMGAHVTLKDHIHSKFVVIDERVFWSGSVNSLSHSHTKDDMTRWEADSVTILASLRSRDFEPCEQCKFLAVIFGGGDLAVKSMFGRLLHNRRQLIGLSQKIAAKQSKLDPSKFSKLEKGILDIRFRSLVKAYSSVGLILMPIPWFLVGAVETFIRKVYPDWSKLFDPAIQASKTSPSNAK